MNGGDQGLPVGRERSAVPIPDPTLLTTQALYREVSALKELIEQRIEAVQQRLEDQFAAVEEVVATAIRARTELDTEIQKRTDLQFALAEQQRIEQKADTKNAVDAALTAQKEAIAKTESATNKQLEDLGKRLDTAIEDLRRAINDNKDRVTQIAAEKVGATTDRSGLYATIGAIAVLVSLGIAIAAVFAAKGG